MDSMKQMRFGLSWFSFSTLRTLFDNPVNEMLMFPWFLLANSAFGVKMSFWLLLFVRRYTKNNITMWTGWVPISNTNISNYFVEDIWFDLFSFPFDSTFLREHCIVHWQIWRKSYMWHPGSDRRRRGKA